MAASPDTFRPDKDGYSPNRDLHIVQTIMTAVCRSQVHFPLHGLDQYPAQDRQEERQGVRGQEGGGESDGQSQE